MGRGSPVFAPGPPVLGMVNAYQADPRVMVPQLAPRVYESAPRIEAPAARVGAWQTNRTPVVDTRFWQVSAAQGRAPLLLASPAQVRAPQMWPYHAISGPHPVMMGMPPIQRV